MTQIRSNPSPNGWRLFMYLLQSIAQNIQMKLGSLWHMPKFKSCGDEAAISYDEKFRQWRQVAPRACPWDRKNSELFHDAIVQGLDVKAKLKKQPFRATSSKQKYCFTFNNKGSCSKGNSCLYAHVCQYCSGKHSRLQCTKYRQGQINTGHAKPSNNDVHRKPSTSSKKDWKLCSYPDQCG